MDMTSSEEKVSLFLWRYRTRWVAWIDIVKFIVEYFVVIIIFTVTAIKYFVERDSTMDKNNNCTILEVWRDKQEEEEEEDATSVIYSRMGVLFYIWVCITLLCFQLVCLFVVKVASLVKLLRSTHKDSNPCRALQQAQFWTYVGIGHLGIEVASVFLMEPGYLLVFQIHMVILSMELLYLVHRFGWELKMTIREKEKKKVDFSPNAPPLSQFIPVQNKQTEDSLYSSEDTEEN